MTLSTVGSLALKLGAVALIVWLLLVAAVWRAQDRMAFPGLRSALPDPSALGFPRGERVSIRAPDGMTLSGWFLPADTGVPAPRPALLWFYGNMETVAGLADVLRAFKPPGVGLLIMDYRGYGENVGRASEAALYRDAEAAWEYLAGRQDVDAERIAVYGRSIGTAIAMHIATTKSVRAVALESPFTSAREMARRHYPLIPPLVLRMSLDNLERARRLHVPLLVVHARHDEITPVEMGAEVAHAASTGEFLVLDRATHNTTYDGADGDLYRTALHQFIRKALE